MSTLEGGLRIPWGAALLIGLLGHAPLLLVTFHPSPPRPAPPLPIELATPPPLPVEEEPLPLPEPPPRRQVTSRSDRKAVPKRPPPREADDLAYAPSGDSAPPPPSNRPAPEEPSGEPVPIVTGLSLSQVTRGVQGVAVRIGNTYSPGFERDDVRPEDVRGYAGGVPGGRARVSGGTGTGEGGGGQGWRPVRSGALTREARVKTKYRPPYPKDLVQRDIEGEVILLVEVSKEGRTRRAKVLEGSNPQLVRLALAAIGRFTWYPAERDGVPVDSRVRHVFRFELYD